MSDISEVIKLEGVKVAEQAMEELRQEMFREAVDKKKEELKTKKSFWERVFPYKITFTITRRGK